MKIRHFLLCLVVGLSLFVWGCVPSKSTTDYLVQGGYGEVSGRMGGVEFEAVVELAQKGERVRVEYLSPASLCGITLTLEGERCEVRVRDDMTFVCTPDEVAGLLRPATAFLTNGVAKSVQKEGENTVLTFPDGSVLTLSPKGEPLSYSCGNFDARMTWWQSGGK